MSATKIEWTGYTWNPLRAQRKDNGKLGWHCEKPSDGCAFCYAETMNKMYNEETARGRGTGLAYVPKSRNAIDVFLDLKVLDEPRRWRKPKMIFPCSMTDLFAEFYTDDQIIQVLDVMTECSWHIFQPLTKRAERMRDIVNRWMQMRWLKKEEVGHIWWGVTVERQKYVHRLEVFNEMDVSMCWASLEPQLEKIDLNEFLSKLNWIVLGGESGHQKKARAYRLEWPIHIIQQAKEVAVPVFFKQAGRNPYYQDNALQLRSSKGNNLSELPEEVQIREFPKKNS